MIILNKIRRIIKDNFFLRMVVGFSLLILLINITIFFFSLKAIRNFNISNLKNNLFKISKALEIKTDEFISGNNLKDLEQWINRQGKALKSRITVINPDGKVLADSEKNPVKMENHADRPEVSKALGGEAGYSIRFSTTVGNHMLYVAYPSTGDRDVKFVIRLSLYLKNIKNFSKKLRNDLFKIILIEFLIALFFSLYLTKIFHTPLKEIILSTEKLASGDFSTKLYFKKRSGLENVSKGFNNMVERQQKLFSELEEKKSQLTAILSSMEENLLVINRNGEIVLTNDSFKKTFGISLPDKNFYWELIRLPEIEKIIEKSFLKKEILFHEINLKGKFYLVTLSRIGNSNKLLITFKDITEFKNLATMKRDFVLNLTHELKTPLTAIKGFVETLEDEEEIKNKNYIEIIKRHIDRMDKLVSDLLTLSELEEGGKNLKFERVNLVEILMSVIRIFKEKILSKNLNMNIEIEKKIPEFKGEKFKLEQMFINLIDNAMKYTDEGSIDIELSYFKKKELIIFKISNTGPNIPEESLSRIFERFYVVDKSRSKKVGGTGLGLSIVKHVVQIHNGNITVMNRDKCGTEFIIKIPV